jgi:hypothetical protein
MGHVNLQCQWDAGVASVQLVQDSGGFVYKLLLEHMNAFPARPEAPGMTSAILRMFSLSGDRAGEFS